MQHIPMPSGYCLFFKEIRETVREELANGSYIPPVRIAIEIARRWDILSEDQKEEWRAKAEKINKGVREENIRRKIKREEARLNRVFSPKVYVLSD